jgi:hypothetical protein
MTKNYIDPKSVNLKDLVKDNKKVRFSYFRDNEFWYQHEDGLLFPISLSEATSGRATFLAEDKAMFFMRWIKRYLDSCKEQTYPFATGMEPPPEGKETY